jgi:NTE family protein
MAAVPIRPRIVIACQGGGSHTAFTAGVLSRMLSPDVLERYEIVGLSGTSGGAICATLAWSTLVDGEPERAAELLTAFWTSNSASSPPERMLNA